MWQAVSYDEEMKAKPETFSFFNCHRNWLFRAATEAYKCQCLLLRLFYIY